MFCILFKAAERGDVDEIQSYIDEFKVKKPKLKRRLLSPDIYEKGIDETDEDGFTALDYAIQYGHITIINMLLDAGASIATYHLIPHH